MQDPFDPYREWLGIEVDRRPPDHYALLGLDLRESDPQAIAQAADVQLAKVRRVRPGGHAGEWGRLLDQLSAAKVCLLDPGSKAAYDATLPQQAPAQPSPPVASQPAPDDSAPTLATPPTLAQSAPPADRTPPVDITPRPSNDPPAPPFAAPQTPAQPAVPVGFTPPQPTDPMAPPPAQPQTPAQPAVPVAFTPPQPPDPMAPPPAQPQMPAQPAAPLGFTPPPPDPMARPSAQPQTPAQPAVPVGFAPPQPPDPPTGQPIPMVGTPNASAARPIPLASTPIAAEPLAGDALSTPVPGAHGVAESPAATGGKLSAAARITRLLGPTISGLAVLAIGLCLTLAGILYWQHRPPAVADSDRDRLEEIEEVVEEIETLPSDLSDPQLPQGSAEPEPPAEAEPIAPEEDPPATEDPAVVEDSPPAEDPPVVEDRPAVEDPPPAEYPAGQQPPTQKPETPQPQPDPRKQASLAEALSEARLCMSERDLAGAKGALETATGNAQTADDRTRLERLKAMVSNLEQFWLGIHDGTASLDAPGELVLKGTRVAIVEASRDELIIKAAGRTRRYRVEFLPTPLVMAVAERIFSKDPVNKALVGTFLAVDPDGNRAHARQLWQEATRAGIDCTWLMPELDAPASGR